MAPARACEAGDSWGEPESKPGIVTIPRPRCKPKPRQELGLRPTPAPAPAPAPLPAPDPTPAPAPLRLRPRPHPGSGSGSGSHPAEISSESLGSCCRPVPMLAAAPARLVLVQWAWPPFANASTGRSQSRGRGRSPGPEPGAGAGAGAGAEPGGAPPRSANAAARGPEAGQRVELRSVAARDRDARRDSSANRSTGSRPRGPSSCPTTGLRSCRRA